MPSMTAGQEDLYERRCLLLAVLAILSLVPPASPQAKSSRSLSFAKSEPTSCSCRPAAARKPSRRALAPARRADLGRLDDAAEEDAALQGELIRKAVKDKADAILLSASDGPSLVSVVNEAVDAGVEVMTFDSDVAGSKRFAFYGPDDGDLGEKVAHDLVTLMGGKGQVAVLAGNPNSNNLKARAEGARKGFAKSPDIEFMGVVTHVETPADAVTEILKFDAAHPQLTGWAMIGGWPLFRSSQSPAMMNEIQKRNLKVVAVDALPEQLVYLERGLVPVLWAQPVYDWGTVGVATIVDKVMLKKSTPKTIRMEPIRVGRDDLKSYAQKLHGWGFTVPAGVPREIVTRAAILFAGATRIRPSLAFAASRPLVCAGAGALGPRAGPHRPPRGRGPHAPVLRGFDTGSPLSVGNGEFAFTVDATGLQTFGEALRPGRPARHALAVGVAHGPEPAGWSIDKFRLTPFESHGRKIGYADVPGTSARPRSSGCGRTRTAFTSGGSASASR
jgi:ribose transport system substrate-binding protein